MKKSPTKQKGKTQRKTRGEKTTTGKPDDDSKRRAEIEAKIRRRVALEEKAFRLVEKLLESPISEEFLIEAAQSIDHNHYADVVEERAIIKLCGYPVCTKSLTNIPKQKYHISTKTNKVYDITERKNFCSPQCFKASKYFEKQLSTTPVWLREDEPPVLIELLGIDSNSGSLGEVVFVSPRAELKAELSELERVDRKIGPKNTAAKQQQHGRGSGDNADIYCKGEAIGRKPAARSIVTACKNIDGVTEGKPSTRNDHQVITPRRSKHDDGQAVELKHKDNEVQVVGDRVESQGTTQDVHIGKGKPAREINSEGLPIEEVARSISNLCLERSLKNLEYLNSEEATEHAHGGVLENVELWKDGDTSVRSTEDDGSVRNSERHRSRNQSLEQLSVVIPSDDNLPDQNGQIEVPCLNAEQQHYNHATVPSLVANDHCGGDSLDSKTVSRSLASSSELLDTGEGQATDLAHSGTSVLSSGCSSQRAVLGTDDEDKDGGKHRGVCGEGDLPEQGQQDMDAESKDIVAAVNEGKMTVNTSHQEDLRQQKQSSVLPESDVGIAGLRTRAAVKCAASNKAQVLAELLDKRDELLTGLKAPVVDVEDEKKEAAAGLRTSGTSPGLLQLIDDCSDRETGQKSAASNTEDQMNIGVAPQSVHSARVASDGGNPSTRPPKTSSARIMANIRRASEQRNRIQNDSSVGLAPSGQRSGQASRIRGEAKSQKKSPKRTKGSVLELIRQTLFDWKTEETARFLSKDVHSIADEVADRCRKYSQMLAGREYSALLGDEALDDDGEDDGTPRGKLPSMSQLQTDQVYAARVMEFYGGLRQKERKDAKGRIEEGAEKVTDADIILPMVDSHSQMAHRRKIVLDKLNKVFPELLGPLRVSVTEVSAELRSLVYTFNLTNTNIILKPAEWTLVAYFLLHLLTLCCPSLKQAMEGEVATHYFKTMLLSLNISSSDVQQITERMSSVDRGMNVRTQTGS